MLRQEWGKGPGILEFLSELVGKIALDSIDRVMSFSQNRRRFPLVIEVLFQSLKGVGSGPHVDPPRLLGIP